jgi:hypothetical protein
MMQPEPEKKKGFLDSLPKLGRVSQLVLLIGIFVVIFAGLLLLNRNLETTKTALTGNLANMNKILTIDQTPKAKYEAELAQTKAATEAVTALFPASDQAPEIVDTLLELASLNDISVTQTKTSSAQAKGAIGPTLSVDITLRGQVPKFQNFLLDVDSKFPTAQINKLTYTIASGTETYDTAGLTLDIICYDSDTSK